MQGATLKISEVSSLREFYATIVYTESKPLLIYLLSIDISQSDRVTAFAYAKSGRI
jgi:hypothetical protein